MKKEDKELLLRDLCARLPYGVKCQAHNGTLICVNANNGIAVVQTDRGVRQVLIENLKPYLRPLSSMTDEERHEIQEILGKDVEIPDDFIHIIDSSRKSFSFIEIQAVFDYLNAHHLDYRGLIEKGLALPVPEGMYNEIKEEKK